MAHVGKNTKHKIMLKRLSYWFASLLTLWFLTSACKHDPLVKPVSDNICDSTNLSFRKSVLPLLNKHCNSCHSSSVQTHGIILDNYEGVRIFALEGSLYGAITRNGEYAPMPYSAPKLDVCSIALIHNWIKEGIKDN